MTRLITEWISGIEQEIEVYEKELNRKIGWNLISLASKACGFTEQEFHKNIINHKVAVIPITAGEGIIGTFSESVAAILSVMKADTLVTKKTDVAGIAEGITRGADILFMADDEEYMALNVKTGVVADNNHATAAGYVTALEKMAGTLENTNVLVLGCGIVGKNAIAQLIAKGAVVTVYDKNHVRAKALEIQGISILEEESGIRQYDYILDATNEGDWLHKEMLSERVKIASLGVPFSLDQETYRFHESRVIHDYLEIGTTVMLGMVL